MKQGTVLLIGRPNVGKSTLVNNIIGQKVAITSPKPQTTRFPIQAIYKEKRGAIIFTDTPGIFNKVKDTLAKRINKQAYNAITDETDIVLYLIDPTRKRDFEEAKVLGIVRKINKPKILVVTKADKEPKYIAQYKFLEDEFQHVYRVSGLKRKHIKPLLDKIFELLPEKKKQKIHIPNNLPFPALNVDSNIFISELIREKIFLMMGEEIPYTTTVVVHEMKERDNGVLYIRAEILTTDNRYKKMLIGKNARKIKEIGSYARKEIALATGKKVYLDLTVKTNSHWQEIYA